MPMRAGAVAARTAIAGSGVERRENHETALLLAGRSVIFRRLS
jgi:hypothetical protein